MTNLLDMLQSQVGDTLVKQAGSLLNENESNMGKAIGAALPSLMGVLADKGSSESGAGELMDMISSGGFDGSMLDNLGDMLGGGATNNAGLDNMLQQGGNILGSLLGGNKQNGLTEMIANFAGIGKSSTGSLLKMAAPLLLSTVGKQVMKNGLNAGDLMKLLSGQTDFVKSAMPSGLGGVGKLLGLSGPLGDLGADARQAVSDVRETATAATNKSRNWLPYLLLGLVAIAAIWWFTRGGGEEAVEEGVAKTEQLAEDAAEKTKEMALDVASEVQAAAGSVGAKLQSWLKSGTGEGVFEFQHATFETGSSDINPQLESEIRTLAAIMKNNPSMTVEIAGHTDNTGDAGDNKELSMLRAQKIKALLAAEGVEKSRIEANGYGQEKPIAANDTEAGREKNRRVEVKVLSK